MSVNIWGAGTKKETGSGTASLSTFINHFIKKSGDVMRGVLNMGGNKVVSIGNPENNYDAVNKSYCDNTFLHRIVDNSVLKLGTADDNSVALIRNNEAYLSLGDSSVTVNHKLILNDGSEAASDNGVVHKGGDGGLPENLKIGTTDEKYVELIRNGITYILLNNNLEFYRGVNMNGKAIRNVRNPVNSNDVVHKGYLDEQITNLSNKTEQDLSKYIRSDGSGIGFHFNNELYMSFENVGIVLHKNIHLYNTRIFRISIPTYDHEVANKEYVDESQRTLRFHVDQFIHKNDAGVIFLTRDSDSYINLNNNMINVDKDLNLTTNVRIHNVQKPVEAQEPANKQYVDQKVLTKNCVGLIPENPIVNGFNITASSNSDYFNNLNRLLTNDTTAWTSEAATESWIDITCPFPAKIWGLHICGITDRFRSIYSTQNLIVEGSHDDNEWESIGTRFNLFGTTDTFPILELENGNSYRHLFIDIGNSNIPAYTYYKIKFNSSLPEVTELCKLQIFTYNLPI